MIWSMNDMTMMMMAMPDYCYVDSDDAGGDHWGAKEILRFSEGAKSFFLILFPAWNAFSR